MLVLRIENTNIDIYCGTGQYEEGVPEVSQIDIKASFLNTFYARLWGMVLYQNYVHTHHSV